MIPKIPIQVIYYYKEELREIRHYLETLKNLMDEESKKYIASLDDGRDDGRFGDRRDLASMLELQFPTYYRASSLLVFWGIFEENFHHLCLSLCQHNNFPEMDEGRRGRPGIDEFRKYLVRTVGWRICEIEWEQLKRIQKIRHIFAHSAGYLKDPAEAETLKLNDTLIEIHHGTRCQLVLKPQYIGHFIDTVDSFWLSLEKQCLQIQQSS